MVENYCAAEYEYDVRFRPCGENVENIDRHSQFALASAQFWGRKSVVEPTCNESSTIKHIEPTRTLQMCVVYAAGAHGDAAISLCLAPCTDWSARARQDRSPRIADNVPASSKNIAHDNSSFSPKCSSNVNYIFLL